MRSMMLANPVRLHQLVEASQVQQTVGEPPEDKGEKAAHDERDQHHDEDRYDLSGLIGETMEGVD